MTAPGGAIPLVVVSGFLGAGKTTLLNQLLTQAHGRRLAVLVNDFGALAIDEQLVASHDGETISFANGCVCCTLGDSFMLTIDRLLDRQPLPEMIIVEASGVADPRNIAGIAALEPRLQRDLVVVVVDAETVLARAADDRLHDTLARQFAAADLLLLNKSDLVDAAQAERTQAWLREQSPAPSLRCVQGEVSLARLLGSQAVAGTQGERVHGPAVHPFTTQQVTAPPTLDQARLDAWLAALPADVIRVKGAIPTCDGMRLVQRVGTRTTVSPWHGAATGLQVLSVGPCELPAL